MGMGRCGSPHLGGREVWEGKGCPFTHSSPSLPARFERCSVSQRWTVRCAWNKSQGANGIRHLHMCVGFIQKKTKMGNKGWLSRARVTLWLCCQGPLRDAVQEHSTGPSPSEGPGRTGGLHTRSHGEGDGLQVLFIDKTMLWPELCTLFCK